MNHRFPMPIAGILAALLGATLFLAACEDINTGQTRWPTATPPPPATLPENATTAARIRARGYLIAGIRYDLQPFGYIDDAGQAAGFDVDLARELARRWLGDPQAVQFRQVRSDTAIEHVQARDVDIVIAALPHTQEREAGADFGPTYFVDGQAFLVRAADAPAISGPASLVGLPIGVAAWAEAEEALWAAMPTTPTIQIYDRFDEAVAALGRGEIAAVADLRHRLFWGTRLIPGTTIAGQYTTVPTAFAFSQNDPSFADLVNLTFQDMVVDGTYAEAYRRWFPGDTPPSIELWPGRESLALVDAPATLSTPNTIAAIRARGRLIVAMAADRHPFSYLDATGAPAGYEVNLAQLMAERWLGDSTAVDFVPTTPEVGQEMVRTGQADLVIGGIAHTRAAELDLDFSQTIYLSGEGLLTRAGITIASVSDLNGQQIAVVQGSESRERMLAAAQEAGIPITIVPQPTLEEAVALLQSGQVGAVAGDRADLLRLADTPGVDLAAIRIGQTPLALGLPPGDSAFRDLINATLQTMKAEGQFNALYTTWFDDTPPALEIWPGTLHQSLSLAP